MSGFNWSERANSGIMKQRIKLQSWVIHGLISCQYWNCSNKLFNFHETNQLDTVGVIRGLQKFKCGVSLHMLAAEWPQVNYGQHTYNVGIAAHWNYGYFHVISIRRSSFVISRQHEFFYKQVRKLWKMADKIFFLVLDSQYAVSCQTFLTIIS